MIRPSGSSPFWTALEDAVQWLKDFAHPELIFMDIMLAPDAAVI